MDSGWPSYEEGFLSIRGKGIYFKRIGIGNKHKLLVLHGGPGATHDYLRPIADLRAKGYDILFYVQSG